MQYNRLYDFRQGTVIDSEQVDAEFNAIQAIINGNLEDDNLAGGGSVSTIAKIYPVGSIYITTSADNPSTILGIGTWTAFGAGKVLVGIDATDTDFNTVEKTGGLKTHSHSGDTGGQSQTHNHGYTSVYEPGHSASGSYFNHYEPTGATTGNASQDHSHHIDLGSGTLDSTVQPYIVVKMWKRTA